MTPVIRSPCEACLLLCLLCLMAAAPSVQASCYGVLTKEELPHCRPMDDNYVLHWALGENAVTFGIEIDQTDGWFALGLSEGGGMKGADIWVFSKGNDGNWTAKDHFSPDFVTPIEDAKQDVAIVSVQQSAQVTALVFTRKLDTCDYEKDNVIYPKFRQPYIFAYGSEWGYHGTGNRGSWSIMLDASEKPVQVNSAVGEAKELRLLMPNITVPPAETSYLCTNFEAPNNTRYQIIGSNYSVTPSKLVHHMLLYVCTRKPDQPVGKIFECSATPPECSSLYLLWVPGQEPEVMPSETGFPFGQGSYSYFMLQIHYTNLDGKTGVKDSSGFRPTYTSSLRKNNLGILWLGREDFQIPAGEAAYTLEPNVCPSECTSRFTADLNLDMTEFHMHQVGAKQTAQHLRTEEDGSLTEIVPLNYRNYYDFNWQGGTFILPGGETLVRGDAFITTCTYNTRTRKNVTKSGIGSLDEMCYNFVRYWPAQKIDRCITVPNSEVNGTALAQCGNAQELMLYLNQNNITGSNETAMADMIKKGLMVQYNTSQYKISKPYNQVSATCTAAASVDSTTPASPASTNTPKSSQASFAAPSMVTLLVAIALQLLVLQYVGEQH